MYGWRIGEYDDDARVPPQAVLLDKDGTLLDFQRTWGPSLGRAIRAAAPTRQDLLWAAERLKFDLETDLVHPLSPFVAETSDTVEALIAERLDIDRYRTEVKSAHPVLADGAIDAVSQLRAMGVAMVIVTNAAEAEGRRQIEFLGLSEHFEHIIGFDSGHGAKPAPGMVRAALDLLGSAPSQAVIVGDSRHDLVAGHAAGVRTVLVTNGLDQDPETLADADTVIPSMRNLVDALGGPNFKQR